MTGPGTTTHFSRCPRCKVERPRRDFFTRQTGEQRKICQTCRDAIWAQEETARTAKVRKPRAPRENRRCRSCRDRKPLWDFLDSAGNDTTWCGDCRKRTARHRGYENGSLWTGRTSPPVKRT